MDACTLTSIWFILLIVTKPIRSLSLKPSNGYESQEINENFNPAVPTERLKSSASTYSIENVYTKRHRHYRRADSELTSLELDAETKSIIPLLINNLTEKYDSPSTTESSVVNKTVIPLMTTAKYDSFKTPSETETNKRETVTPVASTEKYDANGPSNMTSSTTKGNKLRKENRNYVERSSNWNQMEELVMPSNRWLDESGNNTIKVITELPVLSFDHKRKDMHDIYEIEKQAEKIMKLPPLREEKYLVLKETVRNMVEETMLKKETENFVIQLQRKYEELPVTEQDNSIWRKYARAVAETFVLDFCRNFPQYVASQSVVRWDSSDGYSHIYNATLQNLQKKKTQTAVQFAVPVRRAADIYKAILDTPIGIVQSRCKTNTPKWLCFAEYVVRLAEVSETCEYIWYHAQVHLAALQNLRHAKGAKDPADEIIDELNARISEVGTNNDVNYLFDFIVNTLGDLGKKLKASLLLQVSQFNLIRELQSEDKLKCLNIDQVF